MGYFDQIEESSSTAGGNYFKDGRHLVRVKALKMKTSRKKKDLAILESEIVESTAHDPGASISWIVNLTDHEAGLGNIKGMLAALGGCEEEEVDGAGAEQAFSEANPFEGMLVACEAYLIKTRAGNDFTKVVWYPASEWKGVEFETKLAAETAAEQ